MLEEAELELPQAQVAVQLAAGRQLFISAEPCAQLAKRGRRQRVIQLIAMDGPLPEGRSNLKDVWLRPPS